MRVRFGRVAHAAAAGALMLGLSASSGAGPGSVSAREAAAIPGTFNSSIVIANPTEQNANVSMSFVTSSGGAAISPVTFTVPAGSSVLKYVPNIAGLPNGRYSVLIDSDVQVNAIANLASSSPSTATAYNSISQSEVGKSFNIPSVYRNYYGFSSSLVVQNASATAANVTITYKRSGASDVTETIQVPAYASKTVDQTTTSGLSDGFIGSAIITSDQDIAAIFLISTSAVNGQLSSSRGIAAGATTVNLPVLYNRYYNYNTSILVQNVDTSSADVTVSYYNSKDGSKVGEQTASIAPQSSQLFLQYETTGRTAPVPLGFNGSAVVTSTNGKNILAVANVQWPEQGYLETYNGFPTSAATNKLMCASILSKYYNYNTSLTIQNVDASQTANITMVYKNAAGTVVSTKTASIAPGATHFRYNPNDDLGDSFNGSVTVTSTGGKIVATVNELLGTGAESGDQLFTYNCANA